MDLVDFRNIYRPINICLISCSVRNGVIQGVSARCIYIDCSGDGYTGS